MNTKTLLAGLVGGVIAFFLGWLIYDFLLKSMMEGHCNADMMKKEEEMIMWSMIVGNLAWGFTMALVLSWANSKTFMDGLTKGAIFGVVLGVAYDFGLYGMANWYNDMTGVILDIIAGTIMSCVIGGVVGWMYGRGNAEAA